MSVALLTWVIGVVSVWLLVRWMLNSPSFASSDIALNVALASLAVAFNLVVPLPGLEVTTVCVVVIARVSGMRNALMVGVLAVILGALTGGVGVWVFWQIIGISVVAAAGVVSKRFESAVPVSIVCVTGALLYDLIVTAGTVPAISGNANGSIIQVVFGAMVFGLPFTLLHLVAVGTSALLVGSHLERSVLRCLSLQDSVSEIRIIALQEEQSSGYRVEAKSRLSPVQTTVKTSELLRAPLRLP